MSSPFVSYPLGVAFLLSAGGAALGPTTCGNSPLPAVARTQPGTIRFRHNGPVYTAALSPDGRILAAGGGGPIRIWDRSTGREVRRFARVHKGFAFSPDGKALAAGVGLEIRVWEVASGRLIQELEGHPNADGDRVRPRGIAALAYAPEGKTLASASENGTVRLWDVATGRMLREIVAVDEDGVTGLAYSPDGRTLASFAHDDTVRLWEVITGREVRRFTVPAGATGHVAFGPDGRALAAGGGRLPVSLWDMATGAKTRSLEQPGNIECFTFCPDGTLLVVTLETATMDRWDYSIRTVALPTRVSTAAVGEHARSVPQPARKLSARELDALWSDLAGENAARAYRAMWAFVQSPRQAVAFFDQHLQPAPRPALRQAERLIGDLDSDDFAIRKKGVDELKRLGDVAQPALRRALARRPSPEVRRRAAQLLEGTRNWSPPQLRVLRAIEALEHIGTREARQVLERLAAGAPESRLTREARASLDRLAKLSKAAPTHFPKAPHCD